MLRTVRILALALPAVLAAAPLHAGVPESVEATRIPDYRLVRPDLAVAGQPTPEGVAQLKALGFRTVVNLRTEKEGASEERTAVESQGLRYVNVPLTPDSFSLADVEAVEKVLGDASAGPVLLHCHSANRAGGVWAAVQARRGLAADAALAAGTQAGLKSPAMVAAVRRVLGLPAEGDPAVPAAPSVTGGSLKP